MTDKEPYYGFQGALKCLRDGQGNVGFFHTRDIMKKYKVMSAEFDVICEKQRRPLTWKNIIKPECHLTVEDPQVHESRLLNKYQCLQTVLSTLVLKISNIINLTREPSIFRSKQCIINNFELRFRCLGRK